MSRKLLSYVGLLLALAVLLAVNLIAAAALRGARVDLTEDNLYTLSDGTREILSEIPEPIEMNYYFSEKIAQSNPNIATYGRRVEEMLREYGAAAGKNLVINVIDPQPFSPEEDEAAMAGIQGLPLQNGDTLFLGIEMRNAVDEVEVIPFLDPAKEERLEYELTSAIGKLSTTEQPVVGVLTKLPIFGDTSPMAMMRGQQSEPWIIVEQLRQLFQVREVPADAKTIDEDIQVLLVIHPKDYSQDLLYAIDQFVLRGGRLIAFVDGWAEAEVAPPDPQNQYADMFLERRSASFDPILQSLGLKMREAVVATDRELAITIPVPRGNTGIYEQMKYLPLMNLGEEQMNDEDIITGELRQVLVNAAGILEEVEDKGAVKITPLITTSADSMGVETEKFRFQRQQAARELLAAFEPSNEELMLAARVTGKVRTAFPDGPPASEEGAEPVERPEHLAESTGDVNAIIISDSDLLGDQYWVQVQPFFGGQRLIQVVADNGALVVNAVENLMGSESLISIRTRGTARRPFTRVEALQREAEEKFRAREQELQTALETTQQKITELQAGRTDQASQTALMLTPEQEAEITKLEEERMATRRDLREVQRQFRVDIENLGTRLKFLNIGLIPLIVAAVAIGVGVFRVQRRRRAA